AEPAPIVWVTDFGDNSINLSVRVWAKATDYWDARSDLLEAIKKAFDQAGISIPFPQRVLHQPRAI
ncbi:MAG: mechanosensitive ion channel family protein, partial [Gammaproteobacteria bacterium]